MAKLIIYLLESSAVLAFLYLTYVLVLRRETFFNLNRFFLIGILLLSLLFPLISFDFNPKQAAVQRPIKEISKIRMSYYDALAQWEFDAFRSPASVGEKTVGGVSVNTTTGWFRWPFTALLVLYVTGAVICISRTVWSLRWIWNMIATYPQKKIGEAKVVMSPNPIAPFSFFKYVFVHGAVIDTPEFDHILAHERTHIQQRHSVDLIVAQFLAAFFWFNPVIWRLIKSLKTTHEYIADKKIISSGYSLVEYQTLLLNQLISNNSHGLVHNFNLSFIKKRITMMTNKQSGWSGKVKVAFAITCTAIVSVILLQCNARVEDLDYDGFGSGDKTEITLPVVPATEGKFKFKGDPTNVLNFSISDNKLTIDGEKYAIEEIVPMFEKGTYSPQLTIVMSIDKDQSMGFVRDVEMELRKADRRKMLYLGQTNAGTKVEVPLVLPPTPENAAKMGIPVVPDMDDVEAEGKLDILKIDLGKNAAAENQRKVYDFVQGHIQKQSSDYVVSFRYTDDDEYGNYLSNLVHIKEGFNQIYQERAQKMFGKDFYDVGKEEYNEVREGVPMAISIAEKH